MIENILLRNIIAILIGIPFVFCGTFVICHLLVGFQFFKNILKKLNTNKKQTLLKYKLLYNIIEENQAIKEVFTEDDFKLFENKKIQKIRKQKLLKISQTR